MSPSRRRREPARTRLRAVDTDRDVEVRAAHLVARDALVVGQLDLDLCRVGYVAPEGERVNLLGPLGLVVLPSLPILAYPPSFFRAALRLDVVVHGLDKDTV